MLRLRLLLKVLRREAAPPSLVAEVAETAEVEERSVGGAWPSSASSLALGWLGAGMVKGLLARRGLVPEELSRRRLLLPTRSRPEGVRVTG